MFLNRGRVYGPQKYSKIARPVAHLARTENFKIFESFEPARAELTQWAKRRKLTLTSLDLGGPKNVINAVFLGR